jgi:hypothetical protein
MMTTKYFYLVTEHVTDFTGNYFSHQEDFSDKDLRQARVKAWEHYNSRHTGIIEKGEFFGKKFESFSNFKNGESAAYSINLFLVETVVENDTTSIFYNNGEPGEIEHLLAGGSDEETAEGLETEQYILNQLYE